MALDKRGNGQDTCDGYGLRAILKWLWEVAVMPALRTLGLLSPDKPPKLPRVYWMASGVMGTLPVHAAGIYDKGSMENSGSHVSSYITTLKALSYIKERYLEPLSLSSQRILVVAMPKTPGMGALKAAEEADAIESIYKRFKIQPPTILIQGSKHDVKREILACTIAHFACHGNSDATDPSNGACIWEKSIVPKQNT